MPSYLCNIFTRGDELQTRYYVALSTDFLKCSIWEKWEMGKPSFHWQCSAMLFVSIRATPQPNQSTYRVLSILKLDNRLKNKVQLKTKAAWITHVRHKCPTTIRIKILSIFALPSDENREVAFSENCSPVCLKTHKNAQDFGDRVYLTLVLV